MRGPIEPLGTGQCGILFDAAPSLFRQWQARPAGAKPRGSRLRRAAVTGWDILMEPWIESVGSTTRAASPLR